MRIIWGSWRCWLRVLGALHLLIELSLALLEVHVEQKMVTAIEGHSITLPVWYSSSSEERPYVTWFIERPSEQQSQIFFNPVPPSKPKCQLHGDPYIGANVTLTCKSSSGQPVPMYSWIKKTAANVVYFPPVLDSVKGTLTLTNLTADNTGMYACTSRNIAGVSECNITMEVKSVSRVVIIVGAVVGSIAGLCCLAILAIVMIYLYRRGKKAAQDETENDIKEDAPAPKTLTWPKGSDAGLAYKNGTLSSMNSHREHKPYPPKSPSDTTSINTATGSNLGYRPPYVNGRVTTPTPSMSSQSLPTYMAPSNGNYYSTAVSTNRGPLQNTNGVESQPPRKEINIPSGVTPSNLARMGAVPVMVPAQSQAGSLV
ncbi:hypothetical protein GDO78_011220 [Eleutherodactylus coqui]|uniref:Ig-like domain-containing protein n=1 Tax=Eleutherodactylus coqui TaxID=57060 RepID=A0A8J6F7W9_ELECQ|nr:hypothetical protein GDO78_011220 [Eleutherodactylus coqui]